MMQSVSSVGGLCRIALFGGTLLLAASSSLRAQGPDSVRITVRVVDSAGAPVREADVTLTVRGSSTIVRQTDSSGRAAMMIARDTVSLALLVRRIGFQPNRLDFELPRTPSVTVNLVLADLAYVLDTVPVNARETIRQRNYFIDSSAIFTSGRTIIDGWDILRKLRPRIAYGVRGVCPGVQQVWINGQWIPPETVVLNDMVMFGEPTVSAKVTPHLANGSSPPESRAATMSLLASIHPEHVAQMTFRDCKDDAIAGLHSTSALFIVLKNGIAFDPGKGTYVVKPDKHK